jgi:hypothetical protein
MAPRVAHMQAGWWIKGNELIQDMLKYPHRVRTFEVQNSREHRIFKMIREKHPSKDDIHKLTPVWCQKCHDFEPHFHPERLDQLNPRQKPKKIFADSMYDFNCPDNDPAWLVAIIKKMRACSQHTFQILSKRPSGYSKLPKNVWLGTTITKTADGRRVKQLKRAASDNLKFLSIEPLHGRVHWTLLTGIDWVIIGAETGTRKGKVVPKVEWVYDILATCAKNGTPVFIKENLLKLYPELPRRQEFPAVK